MRPTPDRVPSAPAANPPGSEGLATEVPAVTAAFWVVTAAFWVVRSAPRPSAPAAQVLDGAA